MTKHDDELDEYGKRLLAPLRPAPPMDLALAAQEKARFLQLGATLGQTQKPLPRQLSPQDGRRELNATRRRLSLPFAKVLAAICLVFVVLIGSSLTVFAAQGSLPGEPLYPIKSWSEDLRLSFTSSPQSRLELTLEYTTRRVGEITSLLAKGKDLPPQASERFQVELESALQLAAQLDDKHMQNALKQIKHLAQSQGMTLEELISVLPEQAEPAIARLKERLQEQISLTSIGESDPQAFRSEVRERQQLHPGQKKSTPASVVTKTPRPTKAGNSNGNGKGQPSQAPDNKGSGSDQDKPTPANGKHGP